MAPFKGSFTLCSCSREKEGSGTSLVLRCCEADARAAAEASAATAPGEDPQSFPLQPDPVTALLTAKHLPELHTDATVILITQVLRWKQICWNGWWPHAQSWGLGTGNTWVLKLLAANSMVGMY